MDTFEEDKQLALASLHEIQSKYNTDSIITILGGQTSGRDPLHPRVMSRVQYMLNGLYEQIEKETLNEGVDRHKLLQQRDRIRKIVGADLTIQQDKEGPHIQYSGNINEITVKGNYHALKQAAILHAYHHLQFLLLRQNQICLLTTIDFTITKHDEYYVVFEKQEVKEDEPQPPC